MTDCLISYCHLLLMCTQFASTLDLLPTIFKLVGATIPNDRVMDGYDMALILFKRGQVCDFTQSYKYTQHSRCHRFYTYTHQNFICALLHAVLPFMVISTSQYKQQNYTRAWHTSTAVDIVIKLLGVSNFCDFKYTAKTNLIGVSVQLFPAPMLRFLSTSHVPGY